MDYQIKPHHKPTVIDPQHKTGKSLLKYLIKHSQPTIIDTYQNQTIELFKISHPQHKNHPSKIKQLVQIYTKQNLGLWVYYPWRNTLIHLLNQQDFFRVRTARNQPIINPTTQKKYNNLVVGVIGLSVGNSIALSLVYSGGAHTIKLADPDILELSNLNRIRASVTDLGINKTIITARQIYEINPFANIILFPEGLSANNFQSFLQDDPKPELVIDECDDLNIKNHLRQATKLLHIPIMMVTDNGLESNIELSTNQTTHSKSKSKSSINNIIQSLSATTDQTLSSSQELKKIAQLIGPENISYEMQQAAFQKINNKIIGWPQLALTVFAGGSFGAYTTLLLASNKKRPSSIKSTFSFPQLLDLSYHSSQSINKRKKHTKKFIRLLNKLP